MKNLIKTKKLEISRPDSYGYKFKYLGEPGHSSKHIKDEIDSIFGKNMGSRCFMSASRFEGRPDELFTIYIPDYKMPFKMEEFSDG